MNRRKLPSTYGPQPNECVETIAALDPVCVAGNHELLLEAIPDQRAGRRALVSLAWTRSVLRADTRSYLAALPRTAHGPGMIVSRGSLDDPEEYVRAGEQAAAQLRRLAVEHPDQHLLLVVGHTHHQWLFGSDRCTILRGPSDAPPAATERFLINPGSVGQSRERERTPRARFGLVDLERSQVRFFAEPYDDAACRQALRERGLPTDSHHIRPGRAAAVSRRARRLLRLS